MPQRRPQPYHHITPRTFYIEPPFFNSPLSPPPCVPAPLAPPPKQDLDNTLVVLGIDSSSNGAAGALSLATTSSLPSLLSDRLASLTASSPGWATPTATQVGPIEQGCKVLCLRVLCPRV
jgi:hypothetical protein